MVRFLLAHTRKSAHTFLCPKWRHDTSSTKHPKTSDFSSKHLGHYALVTKCEPIPSSRSCEYENSGLGTYSNAPSSAHPQSPISDDNGPGGAFKRLVARCQFHISALDASAKAGDRH